MIPAASSLWQYGFQRRRDLGKTLFDAAYPKGDVFERIGRSFIACGHILGVVIHNEILLQFADQSGAA